MTILLLVDIGGAMEKNVTEWRGAELNGSNVMERDMRQNASASDLVLVNNNAVMNFITHVIRCKCEGVLLGYLLGTVSARS
jgi:hypothetical protein